MFYVANSGDKMGTLANEFYGNELGRLMLPTLIRANEHTLPFYTGMVGDDMLLPPYHIIYLPEFDITPNVVHQHKFMVGYLNGAPLEVRRNIGKLCESGIDPRIAIAAKEADGGEHKTASQEAWEKRKEWTDHRKDEIEDLENIEKINEGRKLLQEGYAKFNFEEAKENMSKALKAYGNNKNIMTKKYLEISYKRLHHRFQVEIYHKLPLNIKRIQKSVLSMVHRRTFF